MCVLGLEPGAYNTCVDALEEEEKKEKSKEPGLHVWDFIKVKFLKENIISFMGPKILFSVIFQ